MYPFFSWISLADLGFRFRCSGLLTLPRWFTPTAVCDLQVVYTHAQGLQWCLQMARGLERLHTSSPVIIHRDLKLENVLLAGAHFELL